jgi:hypothetical protein
VSGLTTSQKTASGSAPGWGSNAPLERGARSPTRGYACWRPCLVGRGDRSKTAGRRPLPAYPGSPHARDTVAFPRVTETVTGSISAVGLRYSALHGGEGASLTTAFDGSKRCRDGHGSCATPRGRPDTPDWCGSWGEKDTVEFPVTMSGKTGSNLGCGRLTSGSRGFVARSRRRARGV